jgi:hypothetical protein
VRKREHWVSPKEREKREKDKGVIYRDKDREKEIHIGLIEINIELNVTMNIEMNKDLKIVKGKAR